MPADHHPIDRPAASLFRTGVAARLALAALLSGLVWLCIVWALAA